MRKFLLLSLLLPFVGWAQGSLSIVSSKSDVVVEKNSTHGFHDIEAYVVVKNNASVDLDVLVKRIDGNYNNLTDSNAICWGGLCFATDVSQSPNSFRTTITPGGESGDYDFIGHVYPEVGLMGPIEGDITYCFFDADNPSDSVCHTVTFKWAPDVSIDEATPLSGVQVYPNPADNEITVTYDLESEGSFELVNLVGKKVFQRDLKAGHNEFELNISDLAAGVYLYRLSSNGEYIETKRLIVE